MRIALFSDIHGHITGLKAVLTRIERLGGADITYCLGDLLGGGPGLDDVLDLLVEADVRIVRGNWDETFLDIEANLPHIRPEHHDAVHETQEWVLTRVSHDYRAFLETLPLCNTVQFVATACANGPAMPRRTIPGQGPAKQQQT